MKRRLALLATCALAGPLRAQSIAVRGAVVTAEGGEMIPYAVVMLEPGYAERFTDDQGRFVFTSVPAGSYQLRVRQVGFTPLDTTLQVGAGTPPLRVELKRIAVQLAAVTVRTSSRCRPNAADTGSVSDLATVVGQLRENAERYRLLADRYPFRYRVARRFTDEVRGGGAQVRVDTVDFFSNARWPYAPGKVVTPDPELYRRDGTQLVHLPFLVDFADSLFQRTHCYFLAGRQAIDGHDYIRLDFRADQSLHYADVDGTAYLDPVTYQVRQTRVSLTQLNTVSPDVIEWTATVTFGELRPNLVVLDRVQAVTVLDASRSGSRVLRRNEEQRLIDANIFPRAARDSLR